MAANLFGVSRYRLQPTSAQEAALLEHCAVKAGDARRLSRHMGEVRVPKVGWVLLRWSRPIPVGVKSYRVTRDASGRWLIAFAAIPAPAPAPGNGEIVGVDRGVAVSAALPSGQLLKAPGRVVKVNPAYTSQRCCACGIVDREARESQAVFRCRSCGYAGHADVNAARDIAHAAGHAVSAREGPRAAGPVHREPQRDRLLTG
ncbi:transposase [Acrocarpospora phusangensis]|uniref:transposase n=1 Tax=Acrocarpospora phusangensis TaxID=1070424 RepID=UPI001EF3B593|nr:transposase [Acrocarpospora phusangensis]